jgi:hypothetical protein
MRFSLNRPRSPSPKPTPCGCTVAYVNAQCLFSCNRSKQIIHQTAVWSPVVYTLEPCGFSHHFLRSYSLADAPVPLPYCALRQCERVQITATSTTSEPSSRVQLTCFATLLYAREGWAAPPAALLTHMITRQRRATLRALALDGLRHVLEGVTALTVARDIIAPLRPSLRDRLAQHISHGVVNDPGGVEGMLRTEYHPFQVRRRALIRPQCVVLTWVFVSVAAAAAPTALLRGTPSVACR